MIRINLLPYVEKKKKEDTKAELFVFAGVIFCFLYSWVPWLPT
jgi:hypothetical protein